MQSNADFVIYISNSDICFVRDRYSPVVDAFEWVCGGGMQEDGTMLLFGDELVVLKELQNFWGYYWF